MTNSSIIPSNTEIIEATATSSLFDMWFDYLDVKPKTFETYKRAINAFRIYLVERGIATPTREDIKNYRDYLKENHTSGTAQTYLTAVKMFFRWAFNSGFYKVNIADHVRGVKVSGDHKKDALTVKQVQSVAHVFDTTTTQGKRDFAIFALMVTNGLRTIEVIRADVGDLRNIGDKTILQVWGKGRDDKGDSVTLDATVERIIRDYLKTRQNVKAGDPLFTGIGNRSVGKRMTSYTISRIAKTAMIKAGLNSPRLTAHSLRHTCATLALLNGATLEEVQQNLRHKNINTTMIYAQHLDKLNNTTSSRVAGAIFG